MEYTHLHIVWDQDNGWLDTTDNTSSSLQIYTSAAFRALFFFFFCQLYSAKELEHELTKVRQVLSDTNTDWERRVDVVSLSHLSRLYPHLSRLARR